MARSPAAAPEISVVVCTRNRAAQLEQFLTSMAALKVPAGLMWEVVVVDNGSTDNTAEVVEQFADRLPVRRAFEPEAGLSNARNRGVAEARGAYICWTDDDVELDDGWLAAYAAAFKRHPEADLFGGRILPVLEDPTPEWFGRLAHRWPLTPLLAERNFGDQPQPLDFAAGRIPWGANYAVRTSVQRRHAYDPKLGVSPLQKRLGEEAEVIFRIMSAGGAGWWVPGATVHHIIPAKRQSLAYLREYYFASGETIAYLAHAYPQGHHMQGSRAAGLARHSDLHLRVRRVIVSMLYEAFRFAGLSLRSLYYAREQAVISGILAYRQNA